MTFSGGKPYGKMFCCHAGLLVHALEKWDHHELGEIDISKLDYVFECAQKHGFNINESDC